VPKAELDRLVAGLAAPSPRRGDERRDLRRDPYDGADMSASWANPELRDRPDPARRLEQDLCDDRWRMGYGCGQRRYLPTPSGSRSTAIPASTRRRNMPGSPRSRPARACPTAWSRIRERREVITAALNGLPGIRCRPAGRRLLYLPQYLRYGHDARSFQSRLLDEEGVATIAAPALRVRRGLYPVLLRQQPRGDHRGDRAHSAASRQPAATGGAVGA